MAGVLATAESYHFWKLMQCPLFWKYKSILDFTRSLQELNITITFFVRTRNTFSNIKVIRGIWLTSGDLRQGFPNWGTCTPSVGFLRRFRDPIRVPRISNRVPRIRENYHRVPKIRENRVPRIREIGSLQIQTGFLTFSLKKPALVVHLPV